MSDGRIMFFSLSTAHGVWHLIRYGPEAGELSFLPGWLGPGWYLRADGDTTRQKILGPEVEVQSAKVTATLLVNSGRVTPVDERWAPDE